MSYSKFKANIKSISLLALPMVFLTMIAIAGVCYYLIPHMTWPVAFVIGAILSPPDAIAASGIIKDMPLPDQTKTILEGESLVNDASALTAYRIAIGVAMGGAFVFWEACIQFIVVMMGGILIGVIMGLIFKYFLKKVQLASTAIVSLTILLPFVAYQVAEIFQVSGVLAVVSMGLSIAKKVENGKIFSVYTVDQSKSVWSVIIYLLSGLIFILIGMEFPQALRDIPRATIPSLIISSIAIFFIALIIRILFIFLHRYEVGVEEHVKYIVKKHKGEEEEEVTQKMSLDWKNALIIGWSGMRGIVSVATAIALPMVLSNGEDFTGRSSVIFITTLVVVLMLLIQGLGLPILLKLLKITTGKDNAEI